MAAVLALATCALATGCSAQRPFGSLFRGGAETSEARAQETGRPAVYFTAIDGLKLHLEPSFSSAVVASLPRHQKVYRHATQRGFARVTVDGSRKEGWVDNAKLIWKLPAGKAAASAHKAAGPAPPPPAAPEQAPPLAPAAVSQPPQQQPAATDAPTVSPTVFDPF